MSSRSNLIQVYNNTKMLSSYYPKPEESIKLNYNNIQINLSPNELKKPQIKIFNDDTLNVTQNLYNLTKRDVLVLNMASEYKEGGGVENGAMAQEEELFRRSNYFMSLTSRFYPIKELEGIYTKNVTIIKNDVYAHMTPFSCSFVAIPAIRRPNLKNNKYNLMDRELMKKKIELIFKIAIYHKYTDIVLGALGCGAFSNPPYEVAELFNEIIKKYGGYFDNIYFAIKSRRDDNYDVFNNIINKM